MCERRTMTFVGGPLDGETRPVPIGAGRYEHHDRLETRVTVYVACECAKPDCTTMLFDRFEEPPPVSEVTAGELYRRGIAINPGRVARPALAAA